MDVYLLDGTYELFRHFFAMLPHRTQKGLEVAAVRGVLASVLGMLDGGVTHLGVATDHVIQSFRNDMWPGYKSGQGIDPKLLAQFPILEEALEAMGVAVWPMVELEADDALAAAASSAAKDPAVERVVICTPDKDLAQCVEGQRIVQMDRRSGKINDREGVIAKFGVPPESIADYLALVGDSSDGFPGLRGWGSRSAATVLSRFIHIESIPLDAKSWDLPLRGSDKLAAVLEANFDLALLFKDLATLRREPPVFGSLAELRWQAPTPGFAAICERLEAPYLSQRASALSLRLSQAASSAI